MMSNKDLEDFFIALDNHEGVLTDEFIMNGIVKLNEEQKDWLLVNIIRFLKESDL